MSPDKSAVCKNSAKSSFNSSVTPSSSLASSTIDGRIHSASAPSYSPDIVSINF